MTTTTTTFNIIASDNEIAGQAPGTDALDALETFNRDACNGAGEIEAGVIAHRLHYKGETLRAEPQQTSDERYTADAIAAMSDDDLGRHRDAREEQLTRAHRDMSRERAILDRSDDPDSNTFRLAMANLASYTREHAEQRRIVRQLERETQRRRTELLAGRDAHIDRPIFELIDAENDAYGLPLSIEEADDLKMVAAMWTQATIALESMTDGGRVTNADVAKRVATAYAALYGLV